jgi:hypothetical protein
MTACLPVYLSVCTSIRKEQLSSHWKDVHEIYFFIFKKSVEKKFLKGLTRISGILIYVQQGATLHSLFYLETALHVLGGTTTHHQEHKQLYLQHLVFFAPLPLPAAIVEELERSVHVLGGTSTHHQERKCIYSICYLLHRYCYQML